MKWLVLIKDYDCTINYYPGKVNVVADALSRKESVNVMSLPKELKKKKENLGLKIKDPERKDVKIFEMIIQPDLLEKSKRVKII